MKKTRAEDASRVQVAGAAGARAFAKAALAAGGVEKSLDVARLRPMLCERTPIPLDRAGFHYELKLDGVRVLAQKKASGEVRLWYRSGIETTAAYPEVALAVAALAVESVVLDGEIIALDDAGLPSFQKLQTRIMGRSRSRSRSEAPVEAAYVAFDVLSVEGVSVMSLPLVARRVLLEAVVPESGVVSRFPPVIGDARALYELCKQRGLEGLVAKDPKSAYFPGARSGAWTKIRIERAGDFAVIGWARGEKMKRGLRALTLASYEDGRWVARGDVGSGFSDADLDAFTKRLAPLAVDEPVAPGIPNDKERFWVRPELVVRVRFLQVNEDGFLRQAVFAGLRPDIAPEECALAE